MGIWGMTCSSEKTAKVDTGSVALINAPKVRHSESSNSRTAPNLDSAYSPNPMTSVDMSVPSYGGGKSMVTFDASERRSKDNKKMISASEEEGNTNHGKGSNGTEVGKKMSLVNVIAGADREVLLFVKASSEKVFFNNLNMIGGSRPTKKKVGENSTNRLEILPLSWASIANLIFSRRKYENNNILFRLK